MKQTIEDALQMYIGARVHVREDGTFDAPVGVSVAALDAALAGLPGVRVVRSGGQRCAVAVELWQLFAMLPQAELPNDVAGRITANVASYIAELRK